MSLVTLPGKITILDNHALIVMANGERHQAVCISGDALPISSETEERLIACLDLFERIADRKLAEGDVAFDGRVWITSSDMIGCPSSRRH
jgi:hypothetical protein